MQHGPTFDLWSIAHVGAGLVLAELKVPAPLVLVIILGTEVVEFILRRLDIFPVLFQETSKNVIADIGLSVLGFAIGWR